METVYCELVGVSTRPVAITETRRISEACTPLRKIRRDKTWSGAALVAVFPPNGAHERGVRPSLGGLLGIHVVFLFVYHSATAVRLGRTHLIFIPHMKVKANVKKKRKICTVFQPQSIISVNTSQFPLLFYYELPPAVVLLSSLHKPTMFT